MIDVKTNKIIFFKHHHGNVYVVYLNDLSSSNVCLMAKKEDESWMWHRRLGHASIHVISKLCKNDLVVVLPKLSFDFDKVCDACVKGKHKKSSFKPKNCVSIFRPLQLLHIDLSCLTRIMSLGDKQYSFVIVDDYIRYTWVLFLSSKNETLDMFIPF